MSDKTLLLFTTSFPYGTVTEASFISAELPHLCRVFDRVIIIPEISKGEAYDLTGLHNVTVDNSRINSIDHRHPLTKLRFALHPAVVIQALRSMPDAQVRQWGAAWSMAINRFRIAHNVKDIIRRHDIDCRNTVCYTFWFDHVTEAVAMALPNDSGILVTGAHGHDIYPCHGTFHSHPFRRKALSRMTRLYAASKGGAEYLRNNYPTYSQKIVTRTLGSAKKDGSQIVMPHTEGHPVTFLSCSRIDANKRVTLNLRLLRALASAHPSLQFRWIHIGDGDLMPQLSDAIRSEHLPNLSIELKGAISNQEVHHIYQSTDIDWVMLLSKVEGGNPIALSEALSYGVPVITCDVPGCREIADDSVGILLSPTPTDGEFLHRLTPYISGNTDQTPLRQAALDRWSRLFDADILRSKFASELAGLISKC